MAPLYYNPELIQPPQPPAYVQAAARRPLSEGGGYDSHRTWKEWREEISNPYLTCSALITGEPADNLPYDHTQPYGPETGDAAIPYIPFPDRKDPNNGPQITAQRKLLAQEIKDHPSAQDPLSPLNPYNPDSPLDPLNPTQFFDPNKPSAIEQWSPVDQDNPPVDGEWAVQRNFNGVSYQHTTHSALTFSLLMLYPSNTGDRVQCDE